MSSIVLMLRILWDPFQKSGGEKTFFLRDNKLIIIIIIIPIMVTIRTLLLVVWEEDECPTYNLINNLTVDLI